MDLNKDGYIDILSGSYSRKTEDMAGEFHVLYGEKGGTFKQPVVLQNSQGEPLEIEKSSGSSDDPLAGITDVVCTRPYAVDLNADGNLDIVSGNYTGSFVVFWGDDSGSFSNSSETLNDLDNNRFRVPGGHSDPTFVDWDGDGDLDMLSGSYKGGAYLFENIGDKTRPQFAKAVELVAPVKGDTSILSDNITFRGANITGAQTATRVIAVDVNRDGKLDLLVGDKANIISPKSGMSDADCLEKLALWREEVNVFRQNPKDTRDESYKEWHKLYAELYAEREKIADEERTGFVWLYMRK